MTNARVVIQPAASVLSRRILLLAVVLLVIAALGDPADTILHLKVPAFALAMAVWLYRRGPFRETVSPGMWSAVLGVGVAVPLAWTVLGILRQGVHSGAAPFGMMKSFLFLMMLPLLISEDIDFVSLLVRLGLLIAILTLAMVAVNLLSPILFLGLYEFTIEKQNAIITSTRDSLGTGVGQFYYKTSPLMIFPFAYHCGRLFQRGRSTWAPLLLCLLYGAAILCSGARANVLAALFVFGAFVLYRVWQSGGWASALLTGAIVIGVLMVTVIPKFTNTQEDSNVIKLGHIQSYVEEFEAHPTTLIWGEGTNNAFFSKGFNDWTTVTEITYLELTRVFGLPVALLFIAGLIYIGYTLFAVGNWRLGVAYVAYLSISASNPLLISSTGFLVICAVWKETVRSSTPHSAFHLTNFYVQDGGNEKTSLRLHASVPSRDQSKSALNL